MIASVIVSACQARVVEGFMREEAGGKRREQGAKSKDQAACIEDQASSIKEDGGWNTEV